MTRQFIFRGSLGLALSICVFAQHSGSTSPGAGGSIPGNPSQATQPSSVPDTSNSDQSRPLIVMGKVAMEDGTPPPDPVAIQLVCHATPRSIAYTDAKGRFSADLNDRVSRAIFTDVSDFFDGPTVSRPQGSTNSTMNNVQNTSRLSQQDLMSCTLQAYQAGFRSDAIQLGNRRSMENPDVGVLVLRRVAKVDGVTISATSALAPKDAKKAFGKARKDELEEKWPEAQKEFEKAVASYPQYASAWYELGNVQQAQNDLEDARRSYARALEADPKFVVTYGQLASMAAREKKWQEVADDSNQLLKLDPVDFPQAWVYNAVANYGLRNWDAAAKSAREGLAVDPGHRYPKLNQVLGAVLALQHDYPGSIQNLRDYLRYAPDAGDADLVKKQLSQLEAVVEPQAAKQ